MHEQDLIGQAGLVGADPNDGATLVDRVAAPSPLARTAGRLMDEIDGRQREVGLAEEVDCPVDQGVLFGPEAGPR